MRAATTVNYFIFFIKKAVEKRHEEAGMHGASERKSEAYTQVR